MPSSPQNTNQHKSKNGYDRLTIFLHWSVALIIFGLFSLGFWMVELDYYHPWYQPAPELHKSIGGCLIIFMLFRLIWRLITSKPKPLDSHSLLEIRLSTITHYTLYILILIVLISGYLISTADGRGIVIFELFEIASLGEIINNQADIAGIIHQYVAYSLIFIVALHAMAALKHHFIDKDKTLLRMLKKSN